MTDPHVLVMAKSPRPGRVKTRLCPPYDAQQAAEIAAAALADTLEAVAECAAGRRILALDGPAGPWLPAGFDVVPQVTGPLGARLAAAWEYSGGPGLQIGMDTPQVSAGLLDAALEQVMSSDAVLGLAEDGGWWAIGLREWRQGIFDDVPMSSPDTGKRQYARLRDEGLSVSILPTLRDLDTADDADAVAAAAPTTRTARTVRTLRDAGVAVVHSPLA